jgi:hypothetical protein
VFFGALKKSKATAEGELGDDSVNDEVTKFAQAYQQTAMSITIRGSFRKARLVPDTSVPPFRLNVEKERIQENEAFRAIWDREIKIE